MRMTATFGGGEEEEEKASAGRLQVGGGCAVISTFATRCYIHNVILHERTQKNPSF